MLHGLQLLSGLPTEPAPLVVPGLAHGFEDVAMLRDNQGPSAGGALVQCLPIYQPDGAAIGEVGQAAKVHCPTWCPRRHRPPLPMPGWLWSHPWLGHQGR